MTKDFRIVFMGTPDFAVEILRGLLEKSWNVVGVITAPDKPAGRGQLVSESAVKKFAVAENLPVLQPTNLKDTDFQAELQALKADLFVVVAFRMLPEAVWNMPPKGTINLHASLLPQYRGAAPINWAIMNGETETGVTTFFIEKEIDTGMVIERVAIPIGENETAGELHDRLMFLGKELVQKSVVQIADGSVVRTPQAQLAEIESLKSAPKIFKPDCELNLNQSVEQAHNHCRGLSPYPTAWITLKHKSKEETKSIKIFKTEKTDLPVDEARTLRSEKKALLLPCSDFYLRVTELQPEGKKRMEASAFLAGYDVNNWEILA